MNTNQNNQPNGGSQKEFNLEALKKYATNLIEMARSGKLDPVVGRDDEIRRVLQILSRRTKNNPILVGEPGTGKSLSIELLYKSMRGIHSKNEFFRKYPKIVQIYLFIIIKNCRKFCNFFII